jgi:hypothetical protein
VSLSRRLWALAAPLAAACVVAAPASAQSACGWSGYSYAGIRASAPANGIAARLTAVRAPNVQNGHVAAWVGVGGSGMGPGGRDEWLQVGLSAFPGGPSELYYEVTQPGFDAKYVRVLKSVSPGTSHRVAILEITGRPDVWRVWVDGNAASKALYLPGSHDKWAPVATTETWDGGVPSCNAFAYRFDGVRVATRTGGGWQKLVGGQWLQDPGYRVLAGRSPSNFLAGRA